MIRTITVVSAVLLTTSSIAHAEDREPSFLDPGIKPYELELQHQHSHRFDMNISPQKHEETYSRNRGFAHKILMSYSTNVLKIIGIPEQGDYIMGAALDLIINDGIALDLNKSKTLALEFKGVDKSEHALYFRIKVDW